MGLANGNGNGLIWKWVAGALLSLNLIWVSVAAGLILAQLGELKDDIAQIENLSPRVSVLEARVDNNRLTLNMLFNRVFGGERE